MHTRHRDKSVFPQLLLAAAPLAGRAAEIVAATLERLPAASRGARAGAGIPCGVDSERGGAPTWPTGDAPATRAVALADVVAEPPRYGRDADGWVDSRFRRGVDGGERSAGRPGTPDSVPLSRMVARSVEGGNVAF